MTWSTFHKLFYQFSKYGRLWRPIFKPFGYGSYLERQKFEMTRIWNNNNSEWHIFGITKSNLEWHVFGMTKIEVSLWESSVILLLLKRDHNFLFSSHIIGDEFFKDNLHAGKEFFSTRNDLRCWQLESVVSSISEFSGEGISGFKTTSVPIIRSSWSRVWKAVIQMNFSIYIE